MDHLSFKQHRKTSGNFFGQNWSKRKNYTVQHFQKMEIPKSTMYDATRWEQNIPDDKEAKCSQKSWKLTPKRRAKLVRASLLVIERSTRKLAWKFQVFQSRVQQILREEGVQHLKRETAPKYYGNQLDRAKQCCSVLRRNFFQPSLDILMVLDKIH